LNTRTERGGDSKKGQKGMSDTGGVPSGKAGKRKKKATGRQVKDPTLGTWGTRIKSVGEQKKKELERTLLRRNQGRNNTFLARFTVGGGGRPRTKNIVQKKNSALLLSDKARRRGTRGEKC